MLRKSLIFAQNVKNLSTQLLYGLNFHPVAEKPFLDSERKCQGNISLST